MLWHVASYRQLVLYPRKSSLGPSLSDIRPALSVLDHTQGIPYTKESFRVLPQIISKMCKNINLRGLWDVGVFPFGDIDFLLSIHEDKGNQEDRSDGLYMDDRKRERTNRYASEIKTYTATREIMSCESDVRASRFRTIYFADVRNAFFGRPQEHLDLSSSAFWRFKSLE